MATTIRVLESISAGFGVVWQRGETQTVSDDLARLLVTQRRAEYVATPAAPADWLVPVMKKVDDVSDQSSVSADAFSQLRTAAASVERNQSPLLATSAWTTGEVVVTGAARQNAGYRYLAKNSGTCGATAPTHTNAAGVSDGAVTWCFAGAPKSAAGAEVPTLQIVSSASQTQLTQLIRGSALLAKCTVIGGAATLVSSGNWIVAPCVSTAPGSGNTYSIGVSQKVSSQPGWGIEFYTDAPQIMLGDGATPFYANVPSQVFVNDRPYKDGAINAPALVNPGSIMLTFPGGSMVRKIRLALNSNDFVSGIKLPAGYSVWPSRSLTVAFGGDSLTAGANNYPLEVGTAWPFQLGRMIGVSDVRISALGGTGFISDNGGSNSSSVTRVADVTGITGLVAHVYAGNHNDATYTTVQRISAIKSYVAAVRAAYPAIPILMFGPDAEETAPSASLITADADMKTAVDQLKSAGDKMIWFYSIINDPAGCWFTSTNAALYGSGDGLHPNQLGIDARAARYAAVVQRWIANPLSM